MSDSKKTVQIDVDKFLRQLCDRGGFDSLIADIIEAKLEEMLRGSKGLLLNALYDAGHLVCMRTQTRADIRRFLGMEPEDGSGPEDITVRLSAERKRLGLPDDGMPAKTKETR